MTIKYMGGNRDFEYVHVIFGEHENFANKIFLLKGWLYREDGLTCGGYLPFVPKKSDKKTFYFNIEGDSSRAPIYEVHSIDEEQGRAKTIAVKDESTVQEIVNLILIESENGNLNYYMEKIDGYWGL